MPTDTNDIASSLASFIAIANQASGSLDNALKQSISSLDGIKKGKKLKIKQQLEGYQKNYLTLARNYLSTVGSSAARIEHEGFCQFISHSLSVFDCMSVYCEDKRAHFLDVVTQFSTLLSHLYSDDTIKPLYSARLTVELWHCTYGWLALIESDAFNELSQEGETLGALLGEDMRTYIVGSQDRPDLPRIDTPDIAFYWGNDKKHEAVFEAMFDLVCCFDITLTDATQHNSSFADLADLTRSSKDTPEEQAILNTLFESAHIRVSAYKIRVLLLQCSLFRTNDTLRRIQSKIFQDLQTCQQEIDGLSLFASLSPSEQLHMLTALVNVTKAALDVLNEVGITHIEQFISMLRCVYDTYSANELSSADRTEYAAKCFGLASNINDLVGALKSVARAKKTALEDSLLQLKTDMSYACVRNVDITDTSYLASIGTNYAMYASEQSVNWIAWSAMQPAHYGLCSKLVNHLVDVPALMAYLERAIRTPQVLAKERNEEFRAVSSKAIALKTELQNDHPIASDVASDLDISLSDCDLDPKLQAIIDYPLDDGELALALTEINATIASLKQYLALLHILDRTNLPKMNFTYAAMLNDAAQSLPVEGLNQKIQTLFGLKQPIDVIALLSKKINHDYVLHEYRSFLEKLVNIKAKLVSEFCLFGQTIAFDDFAKTSLTLSVLNHKVNQITQRIEAETVAPELAKLSVLNAENAAHHCVNSLSNEA